MKKLKFSFLIFCFLLGGCNFKSKTEGVFLFEFRLKNRREFIDEQEVEQAKMFMPYLQSTIYLHENLNFEIELHFNDGETFTSSGTYKIVVNDKMGKSGSGFLFLGDLKINVDFINSYFINFRIPESIHEDTEENRIIQFQRW